MRSGFFDAMVDTYVDTTRSRNFASRTQVFAAAAELARGRAAADLVCVDVGVGTGHLSRMFASLGFHVVGCDSSPRMLELAAQNVPSADLQLAEAASFLASLPPRSADFVSCSSVLEYLDDPLAVIRAAAPVLRDHAILAVSIPERLSLSRLLDVPFTLRTPKGRRYTEQWGRRLSGRDLEAAAQREGLGRVYKRRFGSFEKKGFRLPFEHHRPIATLCLYVFERENDG